jgi:hypothetical protein
MKQFSLLLLISMLTHAAYAQTTELRKFRFALNGGYSYRLGKISDQLTGDARNYMKKLKSGFNVGADAMYYFNPKMGVGVKYNRFQASHSDVIPVRTSTGQMRTNVMDNIAINFFAATFGTRVFNAAGTNAFHANIALGYLGFRDNGWLNVDKLILTGGTLGIGWDIGYDIRLTSKLSAGAQLSLISGKLNSFMKEDSNSREKVTLTDDQKENLSHLNLSLGLRLNI